MDVKTAAEKCKPLIAGCTLLPDHHPEYGKDHLYDMVGKILAMDTTSKSVRTEWMKDTGSSIVNDFDSESRDEKMREFIEEDDAVFKTNEKAMRWIGWLQACIVMGGGATLEDMKRINKES